MNRSKTRVLPMVAGIGTLALTVATIAITVVAPAEQSIDRDIATVVTSKPQAPVEVAIIPNRIEVIGVRDAKVATSPLRVIEAFLDAHAHRVTVRPQG